MTDSEVREKAKKLVERVDRLNGGGFALGKAMTDERLIAQYVLDSVKEDSDQPVTEDWLRSIGFVEDIDRYNSRPMFYLCALLWRPHYFTDFQGKWQFGAETIPSPKTRVDVRRLCSCLGIPFPGEKTNEQ